MKRSWRFGLCTVLLAGVATTAAQAEDGWKTYRNEAFAHELSYPAELTYRAFVGGASGALTEASTGEPLVEFEVSPPDECPRQRGAVSPRALGIERAQAVTQTDGPGGSSACGEPVTAREYPELQRARLYEVELTCRRKTYPDSEDDRVESDPDTAPLDALPEITSEGIKGPTYFVDISPSWRTRIVLADPVGVDPGMGEPKSKLDPAVLRTILGTLRTFPIQKPPGVCIEDLPRQGTSIGAPPR